MTNIWKTNPSGIARAAERLREGGLVAVPTETVYGLAARAADASAVAQIFETKQRPSFNPLIVHCENEGAAETVARFDHCARKLAAKFWPGPLTLVLPRAAEAEVADLVTAGLDTVAVRVPQHPVAQALLGALGEPFVAPSANRSGRISPTTASHVVDEFGPAIPVLDGGPCAEGLESTIVSLVNSRPTLLRPGAVLPRDIEAVLGHPLQAPGGGIEAPGMMTSHYAPAVPLRLNAEAPRAGEQFLGFGALGASDATLSASGDLREAAANLFALLRALDANGKPIAVASIPQEGLGVAINDRLARAAAPRPT